MREFDSQGLWYLPTKPKDVVAGVLKYSLRDGLLLSLTGTLAEEFGKEASSYPLIYGFVADNPYGRFVTLVECFQRQSTLAIPGFASEQIRSNRAYIGSLHLVAEEQPRFRSARATYTHLAEWSGLTGFKNLLEEHSTPGTILARYQTPAPLELAVEQERRVRVEVEASAAVQERGRFEIDERVDLTLSGGRSFSPLEPLRTIISPFEDFLTLAADAPSPVQDILFTAESAGDQIQGASVHLLYQPVFQGGEERRTSLARDMLFTWRDIYTSHPELPSKWFRFRQDFKPACDTYFGFQYAPPAYLETKVLLLYISLGLFLVGRVRDEAIPNSLASMRQVGMTPRDQTWLSILPSAEELSLPWAVFALIEDYKELLVPALAADPEGFVTSLLTARHNLFQPREESGSRRSGQLQLLHLIERVSLLIRVRILECLSFSREEMVGLLSHNQRYLNLATGRLPGNE